MKQLLDGVEEQMKKVINLSTDPEITLHLTEGQAIDLANFIERNVFYKDIGEAVSVQLFYNLLVQKLNSESAADS